MVPASASSSGECTSGSVVNWVGTGGPDGLGSNRKRTQRIWVERSVHNTSWPRCKHQACSAHCEGTLPSPP